MALSPEEMLRLRRAVDEPTEVPYSDDDMQDMFLLNDEDFNLTVASIWDEKAAKAAKLVDITEGQSSRRMSQARDGAMKMAQEFRARSTAPAPARGRARTRPIERV